MLFKHGQIVATPGALILAENGVNLLKYLERHLSGGGVRRVHIRAEIP
jgi:hypothetical protein